MQNNNVIPDTLLETYSCDNNIFAFFCLHCTQIFCIHCHTEYVTIHTYIYLALPLICAPIEKQLGYCKAHGYTVQLTLLLLPKIKLAKKIFLNIGFCLENKHDNYGARMALIVHKRLHGWPFAVASATNFTCLSSLSSWYWRRYLP